MSKKNFTISTVVTAPSPATTGTSLVVASGHGARFAINEPAIVFPTGEQPDSANAEIVMVTNVATDTLTITREQEGTSARTIVAGDIIIQGITAKDWNDLVTLVAGKITAFADPDADRIVFWDDSAGAFAALTASTGLTISGTNMTVRAASETATGIVERATDTEFTNGTDTTRFVNAKQVASVSQTMTNKTLTSPVINTGVSGTAILDEDDMATSASVSANSITTALPWNANPTEFTFDGTYILRDGYSYAFVFEYGDSSDSSNSLRFGTNNTSTLREDENILIKALNSPGLSDGWHGYMPMGSDDMGYLVYGEEIEQTPTIGVKYPLPAFKR